MPNNNYSFTILPNNLRVLYLPFSNTSSAYISLIGKVGRRAEQEKELGAAHFLEHLTFDGTEKRPTAFEINKFLDEQGAQHNGFTHSETVEYFVKILAEKAETGFDYLSDTFLNSSLKEIEKERKVIIEEHAMYLDKPDAIIGRKFLKLFYPNLNIGRDFEKENKNLINFDLDLLTNFKKRNYVAKNFVLSIAGNIEKGKAIDLAKKYFCSLPAGEELVFEKAQVKKEAKTDFFHRDFQQSILVIGFKGYSFKEIQKTIGSRLLARILSSGFSSRLYDLLRSRLHLVYTVHAETVSLSDTGHFTIQAKVSESNLPKTVELILAEIQKILKESITLAEIEKAKNMLLSGFLFGLEGIESYANYFSHQCLFRDEIIKTEDYADKIRKTTLAEVMKAAEEIFSDEPKICILTPKLESL